jgi:hypothetical protein
MRASRRHAYLQRQLLTSFHDLIIGINEVPATPLPSKCFHETQIPHPQIHRTVSLLQFITSCGRSAHCATRSAKQPEFPQTVRTAMVFLIDSGVSSTLPSAVLAAAIIYAICIFFYNIYFHPLAKFPGPLPARASSYWKAYIECIANRSFCHELVQLHARYGT